MSEQKNPKALSCPQQEGAICYCLLLVLLLCKWKAQTRSHSPLSPRGGRNTWALPRGWNAAHQHLGGETEQPRAESALGH